MNLKSYDFEILDFIIKNGKVSLNDIEKNLKMSKLTIKNSIERINMILIKYYSIEISIQNNLYIFPIEKKEILQKDIVTDKKILDFCKKERIEYIYLKLIFNKKISISDISNEFRVTRLTILSDIKDVKSMLKRFDLKLVSIPWKGVVLEGDKEKILRFSLKFLIYFFSKKYDNKDLFYIYYRFVNSKNVDYIREKIDSDTIEKIRDEAKRLFKLYSLKPGIYTFYAVFTFFIYFYINKEQEENIDANITETNIYEKDLKKIKDSNILSNEMQDRNLIILIEILNSLKTELKDWNKVKNLKEFFTFLDKEMKIKLNKTYKKYIYNLILKDRFNASFNCFELENIMLKENIMFLKIKNSILEKLDLFFEDLSESAKIQIIYFLKQVQYEEMTNTYKKNIFIVDSSYENINGKILRNKLQRKYLTNKIKVVSFIEDLDFKYINKNFDLIIFLDCDCKKGIDLKIKYIELNYISTLSFEFENINLVKI